MPARRRVLVADDNRDAADSTAQLLRLEGHAVEVVYDGKHFWLWDGFTRVAAAKAAGMNGIAVNVRRGTIDDAIKLALGANIMHGWPASFDDRKNAAMTALQHSEISKLSNRDIAALCGVGRTTVNELRAEIEGRVTTQPAEKVAAAATSPVDNSAPAPSSA